jgi:cadmium resistance protein CadD (predicted permease)
MSERWKYQIKTGGLWGVFMVVFMTLFEISEKPLTQQLQSGEFYFRAVVYIVLGIFILGYFNWKAKIKREKGQ